MAFSKDTALSVCVAIPTYNRERVLLDTIKQVLIQNPPADEVLVVDQTEAHEKETEEYLTLADKSGKIKWIKQSPPNLPAARNRALAETQCDILIFIDDDVELSTDFVDKHRRNYIDPNVVAVAGRIIQPGLSLPNRKDWPRIMDHRFFPLDSVERVEGVASFRGCNHSVMVEFVKAIGGYDPNYIGWAYREDSDLAIRLWKAGGKIVFDPESKLTHLAIPTGGCRLKNKDKQLPEWQISFPATYFAICHLFPGFWFWNDVLVGNVRRYIFRKDNVFHPWLLPWAMISYGYSFLYAINLYFRNTKTTA
jgi:GT2 family glycosyltransferase